MQTPRSFNTMPREKMDNENSKKQSEDSMKEEDVGASFIPEDSLPSSTETLSRAQEHLNDLSIDSSSLKHVDMTRKSFEHGSWGSPTCFAFGEAFRKRQSQDKVGEKEKLREAREAIHGFSELLIAQNKTPGEIDSSPLCKTFTFEGQARDSDGSQDLEVDAQPFYSRYKAAVFVVHQTHGMLFLRQPNDASPVEIPGGSIGEIEISRAALKSSHYKMQLQIAAREAACRHLYEQTGMDVRCDLDQLQPAVLYLEPPLGSDGSRLLRNELNGGLYYFFRTSELVDIAKVANNGRALKEPLERACTTAETFSEVTAFNSVVFINEPTKALELLESHGDCDSAVALQMVIAESCANPQADFNDPRIHETEILVQRTEEIELQSKQERNKRRRQNFAGMKFLRSTMLCFRKR
ncbi:unnamed protein product [Cylindrotheca closterium]|uniref:Nudix hydrolase domain-containing protein n=1 Tax=Cylindrotheca closterium TaxID=2856 RepID=A0AAD2CJA1_9STRA|nr:unnamed protein product [Cylindrotheca closterium]